MPDDGYLAQDKGRPLQTLGWLPALRFPPHVFMLLLEREGCHYKNMGWQAGGVSNTSPTVLCEAPVLAGASCFCETLYSEGSEKFFPFPID